MSEDELEVMLSSLKGVHDGGEIVDEFSHALQCAAHALGAGASRELVAAALLHDVGRSPLLADEKGMPHEAMAARWLLPRFGERVAWLAGAHVIAKLHLLRTEPGYLATLSQESARSAKLQKVDAIAAPLEHPWWPEALRLRLWDDAAKDPDSPLPDPGVALAVVQPIRIL